MARRNDNPDEVYQRRKQRLFSGNGRWFYHTREGVRGPFPSEQAAMSDLQQYVETKEFVEVNEARLPPGVNLDDVEMVNMETPKW